ncbi:hypothetical protein [Chryseobacterium sp. 2R14A]|uniref:hypothetical protein n=1 Tax=Chryseobacterium sp. 2R14A TaxID=3380353 RepID=UPI003CF92C12
MPLFYSDDAGMMIRSNALGDDGEGGGSSGVTMGDLIDAFLANSSTDYFAGIDFTQFGLDNEVDDDCPKCATLSNPIGKKFLKLKHLF